MFQRKPRRFRRRSNGRDHRLSHGNGSLQDRIRPNSFSKDYSRNNFRTTQSAEKLFEKYNNLAKEALSSGDKTLSENYLQHADHFIRIIKDKNKNKEHSNPNIVTKSIENTKSTSENIKNTKSTTENSDIKPEDLTKNKE